MGVWIMAGVTFREAARKRMLWMALAAGSAFLILFGTGLHFQAKDFAAHGMSPVLRREISFTMVTIGLYAIDLLAVLMTILTSVDTLSGEIASGTIQAIATKPVPRWMWLESIVLLSVVFAFATYFSTLTTGVITLGLHGLAFLGGWIEQFGAITQTPRAVNVGIIASVLMPSEALWRRAAFEMQSPLATSLRISPFSTLSVPSIAMVFYALLYLAVALAVAIRRFSQRDL